MAVIFYAFAFEVCACQTAARKCEPEVAVKGLDDGSDGEFLSRVGLRRQVEADEFAAFVVVTAQSRKRSEPDMGIPVAKHGENGVAVYRAAVPRLVVESLEFQAVKTVQTVVCRNPDKAFAVLRNGVDMTVGKSVLVGIFCKRQTFRRNECLLSA